MIGYKIDRDGRQNRIKIIERLVLGALEHPGHRLKQQHGLVTENGGFERNVRASTPDFKLRMSQNSHEPKVKEGFIIPKSENKLRLKEARTKKVKNHLEGVNAPFFKFTRMMFKQKEIEGSSRTLRSYSDRFGTWDLHSHMQSPIDLADQEGPETGIETARSHKRRSFGLDRSKNFFKGELTGALGFNISDPFVIYNKKFDQGSEGITKMRCPASGSQFRWVDNEHRSPNITNRKRCAKSHDVRACDPCFGGVSFSFLGFDGIQPNKHPSGKEKLKEIVARLKDQLIGKCDNLGLHSSAILSATKSTETPRTFNPSRIRRQCYAMFVGLDILAQITKNRLKTYLTLLKSSSNCQDGHRPRALNRVDSKH